MARSRSFCGVKVKVADTVLQGANTDNLSLDRRQKMLLSFRMSSASTEIAVCLFDRDTMPAAGGYEDGFLVEASCFKNYSTRSIISAIRDIASDTTIKWIVVSKNPSLVVDKELLIRINISIQQMAIYGDKIALATGGGLDIDGSRLCAFYSAKEPFVRFNPNPRPVLDTMSELYIVSAEHIRAFVQENGTDLEEILELALIYDGYKNKNKISLYLPSLAAGITGEFRKKNAFLMREQFKCLQGIAITDDAIPSLHGTIKLKPSSKVDDLGRPFPTDRQPIREAVEVAIEPFLGAPKISIVTRTQFKRRFLLQRLLTSISRSKIDSLPVEVVLSTDIDEQDAASHCLEIKAKFPDIDIKLAINKRGEQSRVANMIGGAETSTGEYLWFVDDDDYVDLFAFESLRRAFFCGKRPFIIGGSVVHRENWDLTNAASPVLSSSIVTTEYPAKNWRRIFGGVNHIPICAPVMPKDFLLARISEFDFRFDLSEDYTLFLLLLSSSDLPAVLPLNEMIAHISIRNGGENTVTESDRTGWTGDITNYLYDLLYNDKAKQSGCWPTVFHRPDGSYTQIDNEVLRASRMEFDMVCELNRQLQLENAHLRNIIHSSTNYSSTDSVLESNFTPCVGEHLGK